VGVLRGASAIDQRAKESAEHAALAVGGRYPDRLDVATVVPTDNARDADDRARLDGHDPRRRGEQPPPLRLTPARLHVKTRSESVRGVVQRT